MPAENITCVAQWRYVVTFDLGDIGSSDDELIQSFEDEINVQEPVVKAADGWEHVGWDHEIEDITQSTTVRAIYTYELLLNPGWNLCAPCLNLDEDSMAQLSANNALYLGDNKRVYSLPKQLQAKQPFWIFNSNEKEATLPLAGTSTKTEDLLANLHSGWNFISSAKELELADTGLIVWKWNGEKYEVAETLKPACGYWVYWD